MRAGTPIEMAKYKQKEKFFGKDQDDLKKDFIQAATQLGIKYYENKVTEWEMGSLVEDMRQITVRSNELTKGEDNGSKESTDSNGQETATDSMGMQTSGTTHTDTVQGTDSQQPVQG